MRKLAGVINELQAIVEHPEEHWAKVVTEFKLANEVLHQKRDRLILLVRKFGCGPLVSYAIVQLGRTMASVAMTKAIEIVSRGLGDITMVTLEALDLAGYVNHYHGNDGGKYPTQLPWLCGKLFNVSEAFRGIITQFTKYGNTFLNFRRAFNGLDD